MATKKVREIIILPIVKLPSFVENILLRFSLIFNKKQLPHFEEYLICLIVSENKQSTVSRLLIKRMVNCEHSHYLYTALTN